MCVLPAVCNLDRYRAASTCRVLRLSSAGGGTRLRDSAGISPDFPWIHVATLGAGAPGPSKPVPGCSQAVRMGWLNGQPLRGACRVGPAWRCRTSKSAAASLAAAVGVGHGRWSRAQALELHGPRISNGGTDLQRVYATLTSFVESSEPAARSRVSPRTTSARCNGCRCVPSPPNSRIRAKAHRAVDHALFLEQGGLLHTIGE